MGRDMGERALVTGATGFIGSHLVDALLVRGYDVHALVRRSSDLRWLHGKKVKLIYGDLTGGEMPSLLDGFDYIFHLGGATRALRRKDFYAINRDGTGLLTDAAAGIRGLRRFIFLSSQAAVGPSPGHRPQTEKDTPYPVSPYGESKLQAEQVVLNCRDRFPVTIVRPCSVYGPRDTYMLELFKAVSKGLLPSLGKGPMYLSCCYVEDLVQALLLCTGHDHPSGEVFFIADGERHSLDAFAGLVSSELGVRYRRIRIPVTAARFYAALADGWGLVTGRPAAFGRNKCAEGIQQNWVCSIDKAKTILGFRPSFQVETGLKITLQWYKENGWL